MNMVAPNIRFLACLCIVFLVGLVGCDLRRIGPPCPELFAKEFLLGNGYGTNITISILEYEQLDHAMFMQLSNVPDVSVRHMLGRNAHLTSKERAVLLNDKDDYVRAGIAMNPSLSRNEIISLMNNSSSSILHGLAMNPFTPEDILMRLRSEYNVPLTAFAKNANCPATLVKEIEERGDSLDKQILTLGQAEKRKGVYLGKSLNNRTGQE